MTGINKNRQILVTGGYGYNNAGDEAQLSTSLNRLKNLFPDYDILVLTHDLQHTSRLHKHELVSESPREAFYNHNTSRFYYPRSDKDKAFFFLKSILVLVNAHLLKWGVPTLFLDGKAKKLLQHVKDSELLFYSGGGYITAKTRSRFWDALFFIACAKALRTRVVLSGQTIGLWQPGLNQWLARWGLGKVDLISLRDNDDSVSALGGIAIESSKFCVTCDDATFSARSERREYMSILADSRIAASVRKGDYVAVNIHYWGMGAARRGEALTQIYEVLEHVVARHGLPVILVPMTPSDHETMSDMQDLFTAKEQPVVFECDYDFRLIRALIADSKICITMKHHPIIFALGEGTPTIALNYTDYYQHKNNGAMSLFGVEEYGIRIDRLDYKRRQATDLIDRALAKVDEISAVIISHHDRLRRRQDKFYGELVEMMRNQDFFNVR
jgi:polysaccharide pyruvyl transferase WcaK-like protein